MAWAIALLANASVAAYAQGTGREIFEQATRPANFYRLVNPLDRPVCNTILAALNKGIAIKESQSPDYPSSTMLVDLLLKSDLEISWTRKTLWQGRLPVGSLDFAGVDIPGGSLGIGLYRWTYASMNRALATLIASDKVPARFGAGPQLRESVLRDIGGTVLEVDNKSAPNLMQADGPRGRPFLFNVVDVQKQLFILLVDSVQANDFLNGESDLVDVYALKVLSLTSFERMCRFNNAR